MALVASPILTPVAGCATDAVCVSENLCKRAAQSLNDSENFSKKSLCQCISENSSREQNDNTSFPNSSNSVSCHEERYNLKSISKNASLNTSAVELLVGGHPTTEKQASSLRKCEKNPSPSAEHVGMSNDTCLVNERESVNRSAIPRTDLVVSEVMSTGRSHPVPSGASESNAMADRRQPPTSLDGLLPPELFLEAEQDLHEKQEWIDRDVEALREMVLREEGLRARTDSAFLLTFLRARKFDYEKAFAMVQGYYRARLTNHSFYTDLTVRSLHAVWAQRLQTVLPQPDRYGRTVLVFIAGAWSPSLVSLDEVFKAQVVMLEHVVRRPITQLRGVAAVVDCAGLGRTHACSLTAAHVRRMVAVVQEVFPLRSKALHFINEPLMFEWMFSLVKPLLSDTIKKRLHFHGSNTSGLLEHIPAQALPCELGGSGPPLDNSELVRILEQQEPYFADHFSYGYTSKARSSTRTPSSKPQRRPLPRSVSVSDAGRQARLGRGSHDCGDAALHSGDCTTNASLRGSVTDVGSMLGSYYRRMCID